MEFSFTMDNTEDIPKTNKQKEKGGIKCDGKFFLHQGYLEWRCK